MLYAGDKLPIHSSCSLMKWKKSKLYLNEAGKNQAVVQ